MSIKHLSRRGLLIGLSAAGLGGCMPPSYRARCRLTVFVEVDGRPVSASAVTEHRTQDQAAWLPSAGGIMSRTSGEGVILPLGGDRVLVAGLRGIHDGRVSPDQWPGLGILADLSDQPDQWKDGRNPAYADVSRRKTLGPAEVPARRLPMFIEFPSRLSSTGGIVHDPEGLADPGANGIVLTRATLELTRDRIFTGKPQETFPWLVDALEASRAGLVMSVDEPAYFASDVLMRRSS